MKYGFEAVGVEGCAEVADDGGEVNVGDNVRGGGVGVVWFVGEVDAAEIEHEAAEEDDVEAKGEG